MTGAEPVGVDRASLLSEALSILQSAVWEAWAGPVELIALEFGARDQPFMTFDWGRGRARRLWLEQVYPLDRPQLEKFFSGQANNGARSACDYRVILSTGELLWVRHWILDRWKEQGRTRLRGLVTAIPEQKLLEWECLRISERERNRIGQELHDDMCQVLAGLSYLLRVFGRRVAQEMPDLRKEFDELNTQVVDAMHRARSMAHGLYPAQLKHATIRRALREFAAQTKTRFGLRVTVEVPRYVPRHTPEQIIHVYRIVQEAVSNSMRHGRAKNVHLKLSPSGRKMELRIEDDGTGFPTGASRPEGIGLHVMHNRARVMGGALRHGNGTPQGAIIVLEYPVGVSRSRRENEIVTVS